MIFHISSLHEKIWIQQIELSPNVWLHNSVGRALHQYHGGHGFESRWSPDIFLASSFQLLELENLLRWSLFTFIYNRSLYEFHIYFTREQMLFSLGSCDFKWKQLKRATTTTTIQQWNRLSSFCFKQRVMCCGWVFICGVSWYGIFRSYFISLEKLHELLPAGKLSICILVEHADEFFCFLSAQLLSAVKHHIQ